MDSGGESKDSLGASSEPLLQPDKEDLCPPRKRMAVLPRELPSPSFADG